MALQQLHHFLFKKEALLLHSLAHLHTPQAHHGTVAATPFPIYKRSLTFA